MGDVDYRDGPGDPVLRRRARGRRVPAPGLQLHGNGTFLEAEFGTGTDSAAALSGCHGRWAMSRRSTPVGLPVEGRLPLGRDPFRGPGRRDHAVALRVLQLRRRLHPARWEHHHINVDLLNAFQGKGLEEGNPRLQSVRRCDTDLPGAADPAAAAVCIGDLHLRRRLTGAVAAFTLHELRNSP